MTNHKFYHKKYANGSIIPSVFLGDMEQNLLHF